MNTITMTNRQVYATQDYFMFRTIEGNRDVNLIHLDRLKKSIAKNYLFTTIIVNENYEIIDGQHRFMCLKDLNLPVNYIVCEGYGLNEVHILNQNSKTWNADDYLNGYCDLENINYLRYREFKNKYGFGHNECMAMLTGAATGGGKLFDEFKRGEFKITHLKDAEHKAKLICSLESIYDGCKRRTFVYAMLDLLNKPQFEFGEFLQKLKIQPSALTNCNDSKQYISLIEEIYNYRRKLKINLRY